MNYKDKESLTDLTLNWYNKHMEIIPKHICAVDSLELHRFFKLVIINFYLLPNECSKIIKHIIFKFRDNT